MGLERLPPLSRGRLSPLRRDDLCNVARGTPDSDGTMVRHQGTSHVPEA